MSDEQDGGPKIQVDSDWKAEAQREKERLASQKAAAESSGGGDAASSGSAAGRASGAAGGRQLPEASFETLVSQMATQALLFMGAIPDPRSGQRIQSMDLARHHIDMLGVIETKTKGNLEDAEQEMLSSTVYELRQRYIATVQAMRQR